MTMLFVVNFYTLLYGHNGMVLFEVRGVDEGAKRRLAQLLIRFQGDRSTRQFALDLDVSNTALQNWLSASSMPSPKNLEKIAAFIGMPIEELFAVLRGENATTDSPSKTVEQILNDFLKLPDEDKKRLLVLMIYNL
jgi:transcriptional regulator with XRE-family HTH domain